jgi:hypothetical protein
VANGQAQLAEPRKILREGVYGACVAFRAEYSDFNIGLFRRNDKQIPRSYVAQPPGIPLDPDVLRQRENTKVEWLELEFENAEGAHHRHGDEKSQPANLVDV